MLDGTETVAEGTALKSIIWCGDFRTASGRFQTHQNGFGNSRLADSCSNLVAAICYCFASGFGSEFCIQNQIPQTPVKARRTRPVFGSLTSNSNRGLVYMMDLSPFLRQPVKTQNPFKGELSHGIVEKDVYQGVQAGGGAAVGARGIYGRSGPRSGSKSERVASLAA